MERRGYSLAPILRTDCQRFRVRHLILSCCRAHATPDARVFLGMQVLRAQFTPVGVQALTVRRKISRLRSPPGRG